MVPTRRQLPTPAWAEIPPAGADGDDTFRPFMHGESFDRRRRSDSERGGESAFSAKFGVQDDDGALQLGLF